MNLKDKTILITGGGSGIGLATAILFAENGNQVIVIGRDKEKLLGAVAGHANMKVFSCDINEGAAIEKLKSFVENIGGLDIMINSAAYANLHKLGEGNSSYAIAEREMMTNYLSVIRLTDQLLPLLRRSAEAAIVNITSEIIFTPSIVLPTYSASKMALHIYTQLLRKSLADFKIKVFELLPPLVDTVFSKRAPGDYRVLATEVATALFNAMAEDRYQIRVDINESLFYLYMQS